MSSTNNYSPKPLPICPEGFPAGSSLEKVFQVCKTLESEEQLPLPHVDNKCECSWPHLSPTRAARVLGFALLYPPSDTGRDNLVAGILGCNGDRELLVGLARLYAFGFIGFFYTPEGVPVTPAESSPAESMEDITTGLEHLEKPALTAEELEDMMMIREEGFCPVTGRMDITLADQRAVQDKLEAIDKLAVAHVVSQPLSKASEGTQGCVWKHKFPTAGAIIEHFGGFYTCAILGSDALNSPRNAMMLAPVAHWMFDSFNLWLTPFKENGKLVPDTYELNFTPGYNYSNRNLATFRTSTTLDGRTIEPPSPQLLAIHASCAQVAHMSATTELLIEMHTYMEPLLDTPTTPEVAANELIHALETAQLHDFTRPTYV